MSLQIAIPFDTTFAPAAIRMLNWSADLCGRLDQTCVLVVTKDIEQGSKDSAVIVAQRAFCDVQVIRPSVQVKHQWPETPNILFRAMAGYAEKVTKQPFFWMEVDCVPLTPDYTDTLELEYRVKGMPYMGFRRDIPVPHISGPAIYPANVSKYNPASLGMHRNSYGLIPFDTVAGNVTLRYAAITNKIQHEWGARDKPPTFPDRASLAMITPEAVIFHRVKDSSLIDRLRESHKPKPIKKVQILISGIKELLMARPKQPSLAMVYIHVPGDPKHQQYARQFVASYQKHPPQYQHRTIIVCQGQPPDKIAHDIFDGKLPELTYYIHDDSGWDIGAFIAVSKQIKDEIQLCFGGSSFFKRQGWMRRMVQAWEKHGPGFYGVTGTYEVSPHLNTSGFWCPPKVLAEYPVKVVTKSQRYEFEHGRLACWRVASTNGLPVKLITWDEELDWQDWRKPNNIFRRGNQSNILAYWHHCTKFDEANPPMRAAMIRNTDTLTDPIYLKLLGNKIEGNVEEKSFRHFCRQHGFNAEALEMHQPA